MELTGKQKFKAMNDRHDNLKACEGLIIKPTAFITYQYEDNNGKEHTVLVIYNANDNQFYKTEVQAFIDKFMKYDDSFGSLPDEEKPEIVIVLKKSKAGNQYVNFDLVDDD